MKYTAMFCGYFSITVPNPEICQIDDSWKMIQKSTSDKKEYDNFYYPEFVAFNFGDETSHALVRYQKLLDQVITIRDRKSVV